MGDRDLEALVSRVDRLERSTFAWKLVATLSLSALALGGAAPVLAGGSLTSAPRHITAHTVTAERLVLVDPQGRERAELSTDGDITRLQLRTRDGRCRTTLVAAYTTPMLLLRSGSASLDIDGNERWPMLRMADGSSRSIELMTVPGHFGLSMTNSEGQRSLAAGLDFRDYPFVAVNAPSGSVSASFGRKGAPSLSVTETGGPTVQLGREPYLREASPSAIRILQGTQIYRLPQ